MLKKITVNAALNAKMDWHVHCRDESAKFWLKVLTELQQHDVVGTQRAWGDGLKGVP